MTFGTISVRPAPAPPLPPSQTGTACHPNGLQILF
jgi:hypothetical protein